MPSGVADVGAQGFDVTTGDYGSGRELGYRSQALRAPPQVG